MLLNSKWHIVLPDDKRMSDKVELLCIHKCAFKLQFKLLEHLFRARNLLHFICVEVRIVLVVHGHFCLVDNNTVSNRLEQVASCQVENVQLLDQVILFAKDNLKALITTIN